MLNGRSIYKTNALTRWWSLSDKRIVFTDTGWQLMQDVQEMQISQVARKLEVKELIQRSAHPTDTRTKVMNLTTNGVAILDRAIPLVEGLNAEFFSQCDRSILRAELKKIAR
jgi:hypothetical protein